MTTIFSSREFNQDASRAKRVADVGPVVIIDRGSPVDVLLCHETDRRHIEDAHGIRSLLDMPGMNDVEFDPPRFGTSTDKGVFTIPDLS